MPTINANNAEFYYESMGEGQPLIFVSGYTGNHLLWMQQIDELSKHFQVITFDNRGVGQTKDDGCELSAELMADDVLAIADALGLEKPHVIGSSMGGAIVQQVGIRHAEKVNKLGLIVTTAKWRDAVLLGLGSILKMREADVDFDIQYEAILSWVFGQEFLSNEDNRRVLKELFLNASHPQSLEDQQRQFKVLEKHDTTKDLGKITSPTLVMYGDEDLLSLTHESEHLAKNIPNAKLHKFSCAHGVPAEKPQELVNVILEFFK